MSIATLKRKSNTLNAPHGITHAWITTNSSARTARINRCCDEIVSEPTHNIAPVYSNNEEYIASVLRETHDCSESTDDSTDDSTPSQCTVVVVSGRRIVISMKTKNLAEKSASQRYAQSAGEYVRNKRMYIC